MSIVMLNVSVMGDGRGFKLTILGAWALSLRC